MVNFRLFASGDLPAGRWRRAFAHLPPYPKHMVTSRKNHIGISLPPAAPAANFQTSSFVCGTSGDWQFQQVSKLPGEISPQVPQVTSVAEPIPACFK